MAQAAPRPRRAATEQQILDAALGLLDAGGREAASIRRIAAAVGVAPSVVYTLFPDHAAVESALVERLLGAVPTGIPGHWRDGVEGLAVELRERLVVHPGVVPLLLTGPLDGPAARRIGEWLLELLTEGGLDPAAAARGAYTVMVFVLGALAVEVADVPGAMIGPGGSERFRWGLRRLLDGLEAAAKLH